MQASSLQVGFDWVCISYRVLRIAYRAGGIGFELALIGFEIGFDWVCFRRIWVEIGFDWL